jgi:hypothetical protein
MDARGGEAELGWFGVLRTLQRLLGRECMVRIIGRSSPVPLGTMSGRVHAVLDPLPVDADVIYADVGGLIVTVDRRRMLAASRLEREDVFLLRITFADVVVEIQEAVEWHETR